MSFSWLLVLTWMIILLVPPFYFSETDTNRYLTVSIVKVELLYLLHFYCYFVCWWLRLCECKCTTIIDNEQKAMNWFGFQYSDMVTILLFLLTYVVTSECYAAPYLSFLVRLEQKRAAMSREPWVKSDCYLTMLQIPPCCNQMDMDSIQIFWLTAGSDQHWFQRAGLCHTRSI